MYNEEHLFGNSVFYAIKEHEYSRKYRLSNMHYHSEFEFIYVKKGSIKITIDQKEFEIREGNVFWINSNIIHHTECIQNNTCNILLQFKNPLILNYPISYLSGFVKNQKTAYHLFDNTEPDIYVLQNYIELIAEEHRQKNPSFENFINGYLHLIAAFLQRKKVLTDESEYFSQEQIIKLLPVFEFIDKNYGEHISLDELGKLMHLNNAYLCRIFKEITGRTITEYINYTRIHKAVKMLKSNKTLSEIAYECGFASLSYFNKVFKKYRFSPASEYRKTKRYDI